MNNSDYIEKQAMIWNKLAIFVPIFFTAILLSLYFFQIFEITILFYISIVSYLVVAVIWWFWTMKTIILLINVIRSASDDINEISKEIENIRQHFS